MKVNSVMTQEVDSRGFVVATSKRIFKTKPVLDDGQDPFYHEDVNDTVVRHRSTLARVERFIVTVSTNKGKFIKTYKAL